jgi:hypothetical protein
MVVGVSRVATDAALAGEVLGNAGGVLMLSLAVSVVAAIAYVPLRPRAAWDRADRLLLDVAVLTAVGVAVSYAGLLLLRPTGSAAATIVYVALVAVQVAWVWGALRAPSRALLLSGVVLNVAAVPFVLSQMLAEGGPGEVLGLGILHVVAITSCAVLVWPATRQRLADRLASPDLVATGRAAAISVVALMVLLGLAGPGHGHVG